MKVISLHHLYLEAISLYQQGQAAAAIARFRLLLIADPVNSELLHRAALAERVAGRLDVAAQLEIQAIHAAPDTFGPHAVLGQIRQVQGKIDQALRAYQCFLALAPDHADTWKRLSNALMTIGGYEAADRHLDRVERMEGPSADVGLARQRCALYRRIAGAARSPARPAGLVVRGVFRDISGYAFQNRQFVRYLTAAGVRIHLIDLMYEEGKDHGAAVDPLFATLDRPVRAKAALSFTTPPMVEPVSGLKTINFSLIETGRIPTQWARHSQTHDHVIVATGSSRDAWIAGGCDPDRISICPEGVDVPPNVIPLTLDTGPGQRPLSSYRARFLNVSDRVPRKNLAGLLRVWLRATRADDDAALILKYGGGGAEAMLGETLAAAVRETGVPFQDAGRVVWMSARLSDQEMLELFAAGTHYWSMSHGEGWDLPMTQAGAMGLTLIAPRHSAYVDYLDDNCAHLLPAAPSPAAPPYFGLDWWSPDEDAATRLIRAIIDNPDAHRRDARPALRRFTWEAAADRMIDILTAQGAL